MSEQPHDWRSRAEATVPASSLPNPVESAHAEALALVRAGRFIDAERAFTELRGAHDTADIANDHGNLLARAGTLAEALVAYDAALRLDPTHDGARFNKALLFQQLGRHGEAAAMLKEIVTRAPHNAAANSAMGASLLSLERPHEAADAFDKALSVQPSRQVALRGRARTALELGEAESVARHVVALRAEPGRPSLVLGLAEAMELAGDTRCCDVLANAVEQNPHWLDGQVALARMRAESGESNFARSLDIEVARNPRDEALLLALIDALAMGRAHAKALAAARAGIGRFGNRRGLALRVAAALHELGRFDDVGTALRKLDETDVAVRHAAARATVAGGRPDRGATELQAVVEQDPERIDAWAHLELAWRSIGDDRHRWLLPSGSTSAIDLHLSDGDLAALASLIRGTHRTSAPPPGQSLRCGTQSRGRLFWRREPILAHLLNSIECALAKYWAELGARDERHPLLRHRKARLRPSGSWSVRLQAGGHHVSHIHSQGVVSSALHVTAPVPATTADPTAGWLELGRPPDHYCLPLEPIRAVPPTPGQLNLFPSYLFHGTRPFGVGERLAIAFDAVPE